MEIAGYVAAVFIGLSLGLIGGGGSILTVPTLVYLFGIDAAVATTYSLFVVGITSVTGSVSYLRKKLVDVRTAIFFGLPSIAAVLLTRAYLLPLIPATITLPAGLTVSKSILLLLLFALLMIAASYSMIRQQKNSDAGMPVEKPSKYPVVLAQGLFVGTITGLIGAGGGFLIIPALVNLLRLPMKTAVGTSLVIIALNSLIGFSFAALRFHINWQLLLPVTAVAVVGILGGSYLSGAIDGKKLKPAFGWFVLAMGIYIVIRETIAK